MQVRPCGQHDLQLPVLGIGCWGFGGGDYWPSVEQSEIDAVVRHAVKRGCNFFDTAEVYNEGRSEISLGRAIKGLPRHSLLIASKISPAHTESSTLIKHCEASLRRLQTDYIDLYMIHWPITRQAIQHFTDEEIIEPSVEEAFETLGHLQKAGKIRHIGVSNFGPAKLDEALASGLEIVINELPYSLLTRAIEYEALPHCRERGVGVLGYMSLLQGVITDMYPTFNDIPVWQRRTRHFNSTRTPQSRHGLSGAEAETAAALQAIRSIARKVHLPVAELALKWAISGDGITSSLCGARSVAKLEANIRAVSEPLPEDVMTELNLVTTALMEAMGTSFDYYESPVNDRTR